MATEFIAEEGPLNGLILALENGEEWIIGRDPDLSNLVVEDLKVSRRHALIRRTAGGYEIENLSATNPIIINDQPISGPIFLNDQDTLTIGNNTFRFFLHGRKLQQEEDYPARDEGYETIYREEDLNLPEVHFDIPSSRYYIKVITGPNSGGEFALDQGRDYTLGTDTSSCDIVFHDLSISRQHAVLAISQDGVIAIEDKGSRNGVIVDRERIEGKTVVSPNSIITLGTSSFFVMDKEAPRETIVAPFIDRSIESEQSQEETLAQAKAADEELQEARQGLAFPEKTRPAVSIPGLLLIVILGGIAVLLAIGMISLFRVEKK